MCVYKWSLTNKHDIFVDTRYTVKMLLVLCQMDKKYKITNINSQIGHLACNLAPVFLRELRCVLFYILLGNSLTNFGKCVKDKDKLIM